jgi:glycogen phosphorylase
VKGATAVNWNDFSKFNAIHVNDSSTALAPIEFFRILIDEELLPWDEAFRIVFDSTTFTQHSLHMARDKWPCDLLD